MKGHLRMLSCFLGSSGLLLGILTLSPQYAAAAQARTGTWGGTYTCTGTLAAPGTLAGAYADVVISGACVVNAGSVDIMATSSLPQARRWPRSSGRMTRPRPAIPT